MSTRTVGAVTPVEPPTTPIAGLGHPSHPLSRPRRDHGGRWLVALVVASLLLAAGAGGLWWYRSAPSVPSIGTTPATAPVPTATAPTAAGPALADANGSPLPANVAAAARRVDAALQADDTTTLAALYSPDREAGVASWSRVAPRLGPQAVRDGLRAALRTPPTRPEEVAFLFARDDFGVGLRSDGRIAFFGTGQGARSTSSAGANSAATVPQAGPVPVLGSAAWAPGTTGFGSARPRTINANGDGSSYVDDVTWRSWGGAQALGSGTAAYRPDGAAPEDTTFETAQVVASSLGTCRGKPAYLSVTWYFPQHGQSPADGGYDEICDP